MRARSSCLPDPLGKVGGGTIFNSAKRGLGEVKPERVSCAEDDRSWSGKCQGISNVTGPIHLPEGPRKALRQAFPATGPGSSIREALSGVVMPASWVATTTA